MKLLGVTGSIGSGKSLVSEILELLGIPVFNADQEAKDLYQQPQVRKEVELLFGPSIYVNDRLDRKKMASIVFQDKDILKQLESIIHPALQSRFEDWRAHQGTIPCVAKEAAILIETGGHRSCDEVILVTAPREVRIKRVIDRDQTSEREVALRMDHQWADEKKVAFADLIIHNDGYTPVLKPLMDFLEAKGCFSAQT